MNAKQGSFAQFVGRVVFPRSQADLRSTTQCPACLSPLTSSVCSACKLDLTNSVAAELAAVSARAADAMDERVELIGRIRYESAVDTRAAATQRSAVAATATTAAVPKPTTVQPPVTAPPRNAPHSEPRRSSVQVILLIVGVALLSIAAIFFLVYAFIAYGILVRSAIIAAITVAAFVVASLLRARKLNGTAEGIAVFASVLVLLDAFAIRANNLFDAQHSDIRLYWGIALLFSSVALLVWHRFSRLRVPSIVGFAAFAPGVGFIAGGIAARLDPTTRGWIVFAVIGAAGLVNVLASRWVRVGNAPERAIVLVTSAIALLLALIESFWVAPHIHEAPAVALAIVAIIAIAHIVVAAGWERSAERTHSRAARTSGVVVVVLAGIGALAATLVGVGASTRNSDQYAFVYLPALVAVPIVAIIEVLLRRTSRRLLRLSARTAVIIGCFVGFASLSATLFLPAVRVVITGAGSVTSPWSHTAFDTIGGATSQELESILGFAGVIGMTAIIWVIARIATRRLTTLVFAVAVLLFSAVPLLNTPFGTVLGWSGLGLLFTATFVQLRRLAATRAGSVRTGIMAVLIGAGIASAFIGYLTSWVSLATWAGGSLAMIAVLIALRSAIPRSAAGARAVLLVPIVIVLLVGIAALSHQLAGNPHTATAPTIDTEHAVGVLASLLVALAIAWPFRSIVDRRAVFWTSLPIAVGMAIASWQIVSSRYPHLGRLFYPEPSTSLVASAVFLLALGVVIIARRRLALRIERIVACALLSPAALWFLDSLLRLGRQPSFTHTLLPFGTILLVAAISLAVELRGSGSGTGTDTDADTDTDTDDTRTGSTGTVPRIPRWAAEIGIVAVGIPSLVVVILAHPAWTWLALILTGAVSLLLAIGADGLFESSSPRRFLGWLALVLATVGLWWRLGGDRVGAVEPYVLPLAGVLLIVALLIWRPTRTRAGGVSRSAPLVALAGLAVGVLPIALVAATGTITRAVVVVATSTVLLMLGTALPTSVRRNQNLSAYLDVAALVGGLGLGIVGFGRAVAALKPSSIDDPVTDLWMALAFFVILVAAFAYAQVTGSPFDRWRSIASQVIVVLMSLALAYVELEGLGSALLGLARGVGTIALFSLMFLVALWNPRSPLSTTVGWIVLGLAGILAITSTFDRIVHPIELATVPIAIALLAAGAIHLGEVAEARSWPWLGPGIVVLLLPPLLATISDRPVWRLVAIGVVAVGLVVVGVVLRLQAPFMLGVVFALIHGIATFEAQIRTVYQSVPWWLWLGAGGVLLIVLAARYEHRLRNVRNAALRVASLR